MNVDYEICDIVDANDCIIGQATRKHIHQNKLLHRSAHILVFNSQKELFLQKRSLFKDESPGLWDTSSAGHVDAGESYDDCAHRELFEELGIKTISQPFMKLSACQETHGEHIQVYTCFTDDAILINSEEISEGVFFDLPEIQKELSMKPAQFTSSFKLIFSQIMINGSTLLNVNNH
jgi:isopentenyl-diphosphate delta-isomerase type 1